MRGKRFLFWQVIFCLAMILTLMQGAAFAAAIASGAGPIVSGDRVYFGRYQQRDLGTTQPQTGDYVDSVHADDETTHYFAIDPIKWQVLENDGNRLFLLSERILSTQQYNVTGQQYAVPVTWETSPLRTWLNREFVSNAFTSFESTAIQNSKVKNDANPEHHTPGGNDTTDKLFLLSFSEVINPAYGFAENPSFSPTRVAVNTGWSGHFEGQYNEGVADYWWLRSPGNSESLGGWINNGGAVDYGGGNVIPPGNGVRPALNLKISSILLTSDTSGANAKASVPLGESLAAVTTPVEAVKFTILTEDISFLSLNVADKSARSAPPGDAVSIAYSEAQTGEGKCVSAVIVNAAGEVLYYGRLSADASGTANFTVPADLATGSYSVKIFNEQINGDGETDYASTPVTIPLNVTNSSGGDPGPGPGPDPGPGTDPSPTPNPGGGGGGGGSSPSTPTTPTNPINPTTPSNPDKNEIALPGGGTITLPEGAVSDTANGTMTLPDGGEIATPGGTFDVPAGTAVETTSGTITLPNGGAITLPNERVVEVPSGSTIDPATGAIKTSIQGVVFLPGVQFVAPAGTTISPATGAAVTPSGTVILPGPNKVIDTPLSRTANAARTADANDDIVFAIPQGASIDPGSGMVKIAKAGTLTGPSGDVEVTAGATIDPFTGEITGIVPTSNAPEESTEESGGGGCHAGLGSGVLLVAMISMMSRNERSGKKQKRNA